MEDAMPNPPQTPPAPVTPPPPSTPPIQAATSYSAATLSAPTAYGAVGGRGPNGRLLVNGREISSPWKRFGSYLLDGLLAFVTLGIGWMIWGLVVCNEGYTPARKMLNMRTVDPTTGRPAEFAKMVGLRGVCMGLLGMFTFGLIYIGSVITAFATERNQTVADLISSTVVVDE